jgi:citronellyl-CoA dehydrogenase
MRSGMVGLPVDMLAHSEFAIGVIDDVGTEEQKKDFLMPAIAGEKIAALGVTEPDFGSNVAGIKTTAKKVGGDYVINGSKTFITNGDIADFVTLAVRTGGEGPGGLSLVILPTDAKGFSVGKSLKKIAANSSHTAELFFDDCKIPQKYLLGDEGSGFGYILDHFQGERLVVTFFVVGMLQVAYEEAVKYAQEREVFGRPIIKHQVWRHRLADVLTTIVAGKLITYYAVDRFVKTNNAHSEISTAKIFVTENAKKVAAECMQIFGGYGIMDEYEVSRIYREVSGFTVGAGTSEIMREIVTRFSIDV